MNDTPNEVYIAVAVVVLITLIMLWTLRKIDKKIQQARIGILTETEVESIAEEYEQSRKHRHDKTEKDSPDQYEGSGRT